MHSKSDNIEVTTYDKTNEVIEETLEPLFSWSQISLELSMKGSKLFIKVAVCHSPDWRKKKKATKSPKNKDDKCFQYSATVALNYQEIKWNP